MQTLVRCLVVFACLFGPRSALATGRKAYLEYTRAPTARACPEESRLRDEIAAQLGRDPFEVKEKESERRITVHLRRAGARYKGQVMLYEPGQKPQELVHEEDVDCLGVLKGIALTLTIEFTEPPPPPAPPSVPFVSSLAQAPPAPKNTPISLPAESADTWRLHVGMGAGGVANVSPSWLPALTLEIGTRRSILSLSFVGRLVFPVLGTTENGAPIRKMELLGSLAPCFRGGVLFLCLPFGVGLRRVADTRAETGVHTGTFVEVGGRVGLEIPLSPRFALFSSVDGFLRFQNESVRLDKERMWEPRFPGGVLTQGGVVTFF